MIGKIKFYDTEKKFGIIIDSEQNEYFFHINNINNAPEKIKSHTKVTFDIYSNKKGLNAKNIIFEKDIECPVCNHKNNYNLNSCSRCNFTLKYLKGYHLDISEDEINNYKNLLNNAKANWKNPNRKESNIKSIEKNYIKQNDKKVEKGNINIIRAVSTQRKVENKYKSETINDQIVSKPNNINQEITTQVLSDKILIRDHFEKTSEFEARIKELNWVIIGHVYKPEPKLYNANDEIFTFKINLNTYTNFTIKEFELFEEEIKYKITPKKAKELLELSHKDSIKILAKVSINSSNIYIDDLLMCKVRNYSNDNFENISIYYNLMNILNERKEIKIGLEKRRKEKARLDEEKRKDREYNKLSFLQKLITDKNSL